MQCLKTRPRVRTFASAILNNANIIGSYNHPSTCDEETLQSSYLAENIRRNCLSGTKPPQSYSFRSIYPRVRTKITPYDTHQATLMSPRYSNVTASIRELIIRYASNNFRFIILNPHKEPQRVPQDFYRRNKDENVHQPLCIDYPLSLGESAS